MEGLKALWGGDSAPQYTDIDAATVFDILSNSRRRFVIKRLVEGGETDINSLAGELAVSEGNTTNNVYVGLYQTHLPKLDEAGFVDLHEGCNVVRPTDRTDAAADILARTRELFGGEQ